MRDDPYLNLLYILERLIVDSPHSNFAVSPPIFAKLGTPLRHDNCRCRYMRARDPRKDAPIVHAQVLDTMHAQLLLNGAPVVVVRHRARSCHVQTMPTRRTQWSI
jgi:hypothetical protein